MKYENVCPACGELRIMRQKSSRICGSCARSLVWETRRLAALHDLLHRTRTVVSALQALRAGAAPQLLYADALTSLEIDVAHLANDVMVAQLTIAAKGVAA